MSGDSESEIYRRKIHSYLGGARPGEQFWTCSGYDDCAYRSLSHFAGFDFLWGGCSLQISSDFVRFCPILPDFDFRLSVIQNGQFRTFFLVIYLSQRPCSFDFAAPFLSIRRPFSFDSAAPFRSVRRPFSFDSAAPVRSIRRPCSALSSLRSRPFCRFWLRRLGRLSVSTPLFVRFLGPLLPRLNPIS